MNVLSLFDGISCGQQALKELGIPVGKYYASEIEKHPIAITQHNFPNTIQLGDITKWHEWDIDWASIDLVQGGSPCQGFSFAGKQLNFNDPRSRLFFEFVDILNHVKKHNPNVKFLLENVRMKKEYQDVISEQLGVKPIMINSTLVSAQNRVRLYWCNWGVEQPEDRGILLKDVLEDGHAVKDKGQTILATIYKENAKSMVKRNKLGLCIQVGEADLKGHDSIKRVYSPDGKNPTLTTMGGGHREPKVVCGAFRGRYIIDGKRQDEKTNTLTTVGKDNVVVREKSYCIDANYYKGGKKGGTHQSSKRNYLLDDGSGSLYWRKLTPIECERLQTLPDNFSALGNYDGIVKEVANSNRYCAIGNGWTVAVIKHIYSNMR